MPAAPGEGTQGEPQVMGRLGSKASAQVCAWAWPCAWHPERSVNNAFKYLLKVGCKCSRVTGIGWLWRGRHPDRHPGSGTRSLCHMNGRDRAAGQILCRILRCHGNPGQARGNHPLFAVWKLSLRQGR